MRWVLLETLNRHDWRFGLFLLLFCCCCVKSWSVDQWPTGEYEVHRLPLGYIFTSDSGDVYSIFANKWALLWWRTLPVRRTGIKHCNQIGLIFDLQSGSSSPRQNMQSASAACHNHNDGMGVAVDVSETNTWQVRKTARQLRPTQLPAHFDFPAELPSVCAGIKTHRINDEFPRVPPGKTTRHTCLVGGSAFLGRGMAGEVSVLAIRNWPPFGSRWRAELLTFWSVKVFSRPV